MTNYLSKSDKENYMMCAIMTSRFNRILNDVIKHSPNNKKLITFLKYITTYGKKASDLILEGKDEIQVKKAIKESYKYNMLLRYNSEAMAEYKRLTKMSEVQHIPKDKFDKILALALANCSMCDCTGDDVENCAYREILVECNVDAVDIGSECLYRMRSREEREGNNE